VASEIDLPWTYVGGSELLVERLLGDERIERVLAGAEDPLTRIEPFVADVVECGVEELLASSASSSRRPCTERHVWSALGDKIALPLSYPSGFRREPCR
jgi:hypothetical protein